MAETEETGAHAAEAEQVAPVAESVPRGPMDVLVGGGGDPLVFGLPVFVSGSLVIGFGLIGLVPIPANLGSVLPETTFATGLGEFVTALWAIIVGQSIVAAIFGLFAAFWFSLFVVVEGIYHAGWFQFGLIANGKPASSAQTAVVTPTLQMFFIAWLIIFMLLTVMMLRLPITYVEILVAVDLAVFFVLLAVSYGFQPFFVVGGACILAFCAIGIYDSIGLGLYSTGAKKVWPPLGPPILKN
jgi:succinate-acetate transporter protein